MQPVATVATLPGTAAAKSVLWRKKKGFAT